MDSDQKIEYEDQQPSIYSYSIPAQIVEDYFLPRKAGLLQQAIHNTQKQTKLLSLSAQIEQNQQMIDEGNELPDIREHHLLTNYGNSIRETPPRVCSDCSSSTSNLSSDLDIDLLLDQCDQIVYGTKYNDYIDLWNVEATKVKENDKFRELNPQYGNQDQETKERVEYAKEIL